MVTFFDERFRTKKREEIEGFKYFAFISHGIGSCHIIGVEKGFEYG